MRITEFKDINFALSSWDLTANVSTQGEVVTTLKWIIFNFFFFSVVIVVVVWVFKFLVNLSSSMYFQFSDQVSFRPLGGMMKTQEPLIFYSLLSKVRVVITLTFEGIS